MLLLNKTTEPQTSPVEKSFFGSHRPQFGRIIRANNSFMASDLRGIARPKEERETIANSLLLKPF
jgi:hypothetical protein